MREDIEGNASKISKTIPVSAAEFHWLNTTTADLILICQTKQYSIIFCGLPLVVMNSVLRYSVLACVCISAASKYIVESKVADGVSISASLIWQDVADEPAALPAGTTPITPLHLDVRYSTADRLRVRITDPNNERWEVISKIIKTRNYHMI